MVYSWAIRSAPEPHEYNFVPNVEAFYFAIIMLGLIKINIISNTEAI